MSTETCESEQTDTGPRNLSSIKRVSSQNVVGVGTDVSCSRECHFPEVFEKSDNTVPVWVESAQMDPGTRNVSMNLGESRGVGTAGLGRGLAIWAMFPKVDTPGFHVRARKCVCVCVTC